MQQKCTPKFIKCAMEKHLQVPLSGASKHLKDKSFCAAWKLIFSSNNLMFTPSQKDEVTAPSLAASSSKMLAERCPWRPAGTRPWEEGREDSALPVDLWLRAVCLHWQSYFGLRVDVCQKVKSLIHPVEFVWRHKDYHVQDGSLLRPSLSLLKEFWATHSQSILQN